jgi:hypothetical protein
LENIVYKISNDTVIPYYEFNNLSGYKSMTMDEIRNFEYILDGNKNNPLQQKEKQGYLLTHGEVIETNEYTVSLFRGDDKLRYLYYNKKTSKSYFVDPDLVKGDKNVVKFFFNELCAVKDDRFYISPSEYIMYLLKGKINFNDNKLKEFIEKTDMDSNPLLVSFKIKFPEN